MYSLVMEKISVTKARTVMAEIIGRVMFGGERVILERNGKDVAAVVPMEDLRLMERLIEEEEDRIDLEEAQKALSDPQNRKPIPLEKVRKDLGL